MSSKVIPPFPVFNDIDGDPLDAGFIFIGEAGKNPEVYPVEAFWDEGLTVPAAQPIRTRNGYLSKNGKPGKVYIAGEKCSITIKNKRNTLISTDLNANLQITIDTIITKIQSAIRNVETIAGLMEVDDKKNGQIVFVSSFDATRPFGGGFFRYNSSRQSDNDGISVFNGWERWGLSEKISPFLAGAYGDFLTDDIAAIEKTQEFARANGYQVLINGSFAVSREIVIKSNDYMTGTKLGSRIKKLNTTLSVLEKRQAPERTTGDFDNYNVDAVIIFYPTDNNYVSSATLKDLNLYNKVYGDTNPGEYGIYAPRVASLNIAGVRIENVKRGFKSKNIFQSRITDLTSIANQTSGFVNEGVLGFDISDDFAGRTGTSNLFDNVLIVNYQNGFNIENLQTSTFQKCYGEQIHKDNGTKESINFRFRNPFNITMMSCGQEQTRCCCIYAESDSATRPSLDVIGYQAYWGVSGTSTDLGINLITLIGNIDVTFKTSTFKKDQSFIFDGLYTSGAAKVINDLSTLGAGLIISSTTTYISLENVLQSGDGGMIKSSVAVGTDLNNGIEWKQGVVHKPVDGATLNLPSGLADAYGFSSYYGQNATQGVQLLYLTNSTEVYKRRIFSQTSIGPWSTV